MKTSATTLSGAHHLHLELENRQKRVTTKISAGTLVSQKAPDWHRFEYVNIDGFGFVSATVSQLAATILEQARQERGGWVVTPNLDILRRLRLEPAFRTLVKDASYFTADGFPLVLASRIQGTPLPERLTGADLFIKLFGLACKAGVPMALIGGNPGVADAATEILCRENERPRTLIETLCPPNGFEDDPKQMAAILKMITRTRPRIVFVGLGSPKQEELIAKLRVIHPHAWYLGVGASFSFVCGDIKRAPKLLQRVGMEWLHRFVQEPTRLWKRYFVHGIGFGLGLMARASYRRLAGVPAVPHEDTGPGAR